jgi:hypothetical protein
MSRLTYLTLLTLALVASAQVRVYYAYDGVLTETLNLHFQSSPNLTNWQTFSTLTNVTEGTNSVPVSLVPPLMFFRVVASNEWGVSNSNVLTSAPPVAGKVRIR